MGDLSWNEKKVGVIFGFLRQILTLAKLFETNKFVFAWDSRSSIRIKMFPDYKKARRREKSPDEEAFDNLTYDQFNKLREEIIPDIGFLNNFMQEGFEADDIIASVIHSNPSLKITIISTDEDLYQLLSDNVDMYSIKKKQLYTYLNLWKDYRISPVEWIDAKSIAGCSTDGVPGVPGVGEKTSCKYLSRALNPLHKTYRAIKDSTDLIERNRKLIQLPLEGTLRYPIRINEHLSVGNFIDICNEYGFMSFLGQDTLKKWKEYIFHG
jgi:DNA polymerase-1